MDGIVGMEGQRAFCRRCPAYWSPADEPEPIRSGCGIRFACGSSGGKVCTIRSAEERGLCSSNIGNIEIVGDSFRQLYIHDFKLPDSSHAGLLVRALESNNRIAEFLKKIFEALSRLCMISA